MSSRRIVIFGWSISIHVRRWIHGLVERGFTIKLISYGDDKIDSTQIHGPLPESVEVVEIPRKGAFSFFASINKVKREVKKFKPDLVHAHYITGFGVWSQFVGFKPTMLSVWGSDVVDRVDSGIIRFFSKRALRLATYITATSSYLKSVTTRLEPSVNNKITVIPFGVDLPEKKPETNLSEKISICFIKILKIVSGADILIDAMRIVVKKIPNISLTIAGIGPEKGDLEGQVREYNLTDNISFESWLDRDKLPEFFSKQHFMVMPSRRESFGVAALEAASYGLPVIGSNVGGISEVIDEGKTGLLVEPENPESLADKIIYLAENKELRQSMSENAYNYVKDNYNWEKSLDLMTALYDKLISDSK